MLGQALCLTAQLRLLPGQTEQPEPERTSPNQVTSLLPHGLQLHVPGRSGDLHPAAGFLLEKGLIPGEHPLGCTDLTDRSRALDLVSVLCLGLCAMSLYLLAVGIIKT